MLVSCFEYELAYFPVPRAGEHFTGLQDPKFPGASD